MKYFCLPNLILLFLLTYGCGLKGTCVSGDCENGEGSFSYEDGTVYQGSFAGGLPEGQGVLRRVNKEVYTGEFNHGQYQGFGELTYPDGTKYEGEFSKGKPHGGGMFTRWDGSRYEGSFVAGNFTGQGKIVFPDGQELPCYSKNGIFLAKKTAPAEKTVDGASLEAENTFQAEAENPATGDDEIEGIADDTEQTAAGEQQTAEKKMVMAGVCEMGDCENGEGSFFFEDNSLYYGTFTDGLPNGKGTLNRANGEIYTGEFQNGLPHGYGTLEYPDGTIYEGLFEFGEKIEQ